MSKETSDEIISAYFDAKQGVHDLLGYQSDWVEIPMEDNRKYYWLLTKGDGGGSSVVYSTEPLTAESIEAGKKIYSGTIYTQRFLPKYVYRSDNHVMVSVDTHTDGNKFLMIFDADKECTDDSLRELGGIW